MGWSWRRSSSFGPFRLNFSKSGLGMSAGVRGARLSVGPRGTYVNVGAGGFRYSHRLGGPGVENTVIPSARPGFPSARQVSPLGHSVEAIAPAQLIDTSSDALLEEIRSKQQIMGVLPLAIGASVIGFIAFLLLLEAPGAEAVKWGMLALGIIGLLCLPRAAWRDRRARLVRVHYAFDYWGKRVQENLERLLQVLERGHAIWAVNSENVHGDWKRNAGAGTSVTRRRIQVGWGAPAFIETNARIGFLNVAGTRLYLFPDRLLILGNGGVRAVPYGDLSVKAGTVSFREEGGVPADAKVTGKTWRYLNKNGGPDRRFNNNYQIPVVSYGTLEVSAPSGLRLSLQTSAESLATDSAKLVRDLQSAVCDLERQRASSPQQESLPAFTEEPAPLSLPSAKILKPIGDALAFRWFDALPGWASPIAWGLLLSLPMVALLAWFSTKSIAAGCFLCASFVLAGGGAGRLFYEFLRQSREARREKASASRSRFRAVLANELRTQPLDVVKFPELVSESDVAREDADRIADELFGKVIGKFLADAILTDRERAKLEALAHALEINPARAKRLEAEAKSERYRKAVSDALADGTVTAAEAHMLNELKARLGIEDSTWTPGDLAHRG